MDATAASTLGRRTGLAPSVLEWKWVVFSVLLLMWYLRSYYRSGLWCIPGPFLRSVSIIPRLVSVYRGASHKDDLDLHQKYGRIVRTAPNQLSISDPDEIKRIYGTGTQFLKSPFYSLSEAHDEEGLIPDTFILKDMKKHTYMKRNAANAYAMHGLVQMEACVEPVTERLLDILRVHTRQQKAAPLDKLLKNYTMDAITAITFGRDFDYLGKGDTLNLHRVGEIVAGYMAIFGQIAWTHKFLLEVPFIAKLVLPANGDADIFALVGHEIQHRREVKEESRTLTFLQRLLLNQQQHPEQLTNRDILTHAFGNLMAGSDTTAIAMQSVFLNILKNPHVYHKLCAEIRSSLTSLPVTYTRANALPYLGAVIKEAIRIHPSVGMMLARTVPADGATLCGYKVPAGTEVGINPWVLHRDPAIFTDPDDFRPERWIARNESDEEEQGHLRLMNRCFLAFGHGAHTCSGRWISLMETVKLVPTILLCFDLELADGASQHSVLNRWFLFQTGINVRLVERDVGPLVAAGTKGGVDA
ncbi:cytochrome P450 [Aspergillus californicus]